jgi:hypothetical protein
MPDVVKGCFECQTVFPESQADARAPLNVVFPTQSLADFDVKSKGLSTSPIAISIFDHVRDAHIDMENAPRTKAGCVPDLSSLHPNMKTIGSTTPFVMDVLKACLQQVGVDQSKSDYVVQSVKMRLEHAVDGSSTAKKGPVCRGAVIQEKASQKVGKSEKRNLPHCSPGGMTMMICNIPCRVRHEELIEAIEATGFGGTFDFVHIPCRFGQSDSNLGYSFVHFFRKEDAENFAVAFEGYRFNRKESSKACTVKLADCQGSNGSNRRLPRNMRLAQKK